MPQRHDDRRVCGGVQRFGESQREERIPRFAETNAPRGVELPVDGGERRHARIVDRRDGRRRVVDRRHRERQPPRRLTAFDELGLHLAQQKPIGAARIAGAGQAFILHDLETDLTPRSSAGLQRDDVGLAIRIRAARDDETVAGLGVGFQTAVEIEIAFDRLLVVDGERRAVQRTRGNRALPRPGQLAGLPAPVQSGFSRLFVSCPHRGRFLEAQPGGRKLRVEGRERRLLRLGRQRELRAPRARAAIGHEPRLLDVGEERLHRVEVLREERIEPVVVAFGASERAAQPHGADRAHAVGAVLREVFLGLKPAFGRRAIQAVVGRRDALFDGRVWQQVAGDLFARELVERPVLQKCLQHVVAVRPGRNRIVAMEPRRVPVTHRVEPVHGALLGIPRRGQQPIHHSFVRIRRRVRQERARVFWRGQQACQIERHAPEQRAFVGLDRRRQLLAAQPILDELIDRVPDSRRVHDRRNGRTLHRLIGPVTFVDRAFRDPAANGVLLCLGQLLVRGSGRHDARAFRENARDDLALVGIAGHNRNAARARRLDALPRECRGACRPCARSCRDRGTGSTYPT